MPPFMAHRVFPSPNRHPVSPIPPISPQTVLTLLHGELLELPDAFLPQERLLVVFGVVIVAVVMFLVAQFLMRMNVSYNKHATEDATLL